MLKIHTCEQGTREWGEARMAIPTSSMFQAVISSGRGKQPSLTRLTYMYRLAGEAVTGELQEGFKTKTTERGHAMEIKARELYEFERDVVVDQVGFIRSGNIGSSPDGLIGENGCIEIKSKAPHILIPLLLSNEMPDEHKAQVQGQIMVSEREWCDFIGYYDRMPTLITRVYRDDAYCRELYAALNIFNYELNELTEKLRGMM